MTSYRAWWRDKKCCVRIDIDGFRNKHEKYIFRKTFRNKEKGSEAKCLEAMIYVVEVVGIEPATS